jgi:predicted O-methyltransferase YrrM
VTLQLEADAASLRRSLGRQCPEMPPLPTVKKQLLEYQSLALFVLAREQNRAGARILEIGTGHGSSGYLLSRAAPRASITSLTTCQHEAPAAERFWRSQGCRNIQVHVEASWDCLARSTETWDMVFVDGDHNRIARDLPWFDRLREGGLLLCHDYSPQDSRSPSGIVYAELNALAAKLGRPFDVRIVDEGKVGMAGFYRRRGEAFGDQTAIPIIQSHQSSGSGIVLRQDDASARKKAVASGLAVTVSHEWPLSWARTLFAASAVNVPWDLLRVGFNFLAKWDLAAPFSRDRILAQDIGTPEDRERTRAMVRDLRIPVYAHELLFVRASDAGRAFLERWRAECDGGDERLAFLRALSMVKPRFCVLPRVWLGESAAQAKTVNPQRITAPAPPPVPSRGEPERAASHRVLLRRRRR